MKSRGKGGAEAAGEIEGEVDRRELDMGERVEHRDASAVRAALAALGHARRRQQKRRIGPRRAIGHRHVETMLQPPLPPRARGLPRRSHLVARLGGEQDRAAGFSDGFDGKSPVVALLIFQTHTRSS